MTESAGRVKIALLSHVLPPSWSGQAVMLHRLLEDLGPEDYCLISSEYYEAGGGGDAYARTLPGRYHHLPPEPRLYRGHRFGLGHVRELINAPPGVVVRGRRVAEIVRRERCAAVVACTGDPYDLPAGYLAARLAGVPFYAYVFDYYAHQFIEPAKRLIARLLEPRLMRGAAGVIVPNETLRDELRRRYGVEPVVIHNPCDPLLYERAPAAGTGRGDGEVRITYTGAVYDAHYDAFRNLVAALEALGRADVKLHLYTAQSPALLAEHGIRGPVVFHEHRQASEMPRVHRESDVLFLPLAFNSPYPEIVRTSAPGKVAEYMASRRPVLVHAPPDSFISRYFRQHDCGSVVDVNDPAPLGRAVEQLLSDAALRERLGERAWERVVADFSVEKARATFAELLGRGGARPARKRAKPAPEF